MTRRNLLLEVIEAVATADGVEPGEVDPLYDSIDPRILELLDGQNGEWGFTFRFADHRITVTQDSEILVDGEAYRSEKSA